MRRRTLKIREKMMKTLFVCCMLVLVAGCGKPGPDENGNYPEEVNREFKKTINSGSLADVQKFVQDYPGIVNSYGHLHFVYAAGTGKSEVAMWMLENAVDAPKLNSSKRPLLAILGSLDNADELVSMVPLLVKKGAAVEADRKFDGPLDSSVRKGNVKFAAALIAAGANVNRKGPKGNTPLHHAQRCFKADRLLEMVQLLLDKGADVNAVNNAGKTPLDLSGGKAAELLRAKGGKKKEELEQK